jgi:hypothetical protein
VTIGAFGAHVINITGLRIVFEVDKTDGRDANTAKIDIYNLSEETRSTIKTLNQFIILNAGYKDGDGEQLLFSGDITSITHRKNVPDVITTIEASDGKTSLTDYKISLSHAAGVSATTILKKILSTFSISNNFEMIQYTDKKYANGFSFIGLARDALTKVTEFLSLDWTIQNNEIKLTLFDKDDQTQSIYLTEETGLVGSPEKITDSVRKVKKKSSEDKIAWRLTSLLLPKLNPKNKVVVSSSEIFINSVFTISTVNHRGDTNGSEWNTVIEVRE